MGLDAGFEVYDEQFSVQEVDQEQRRAQETTDAVLAWLSRSELGRAFVWVHYFDPHYPYTPPAPYDRIYGDDYAGLADGSMEYLAGLWAKGSARTQASDADIQRLVDLYDGEIAYTDSQVGRLIAAIDEAGLGEDSIIALTADHGESLTEHDYLFNHGLYLYEPSLRVPLILRLPPSFGVEATVVGAQVQNLDLFPTLLEAAGLEVPEETEGLSLLPLIRGDRESVRELSFAEAARPWKVERRYPGQYRNLHKAQVVVEGPWKLIVTPHRDKKELYHTGRDPGEQSNQIAEHTMVSSRLYHALREWRREDLPGDAVPTPENLRRLKALGYVE
jgi:arylsulfatase A-like enzyme